MVLSLVAMAYAAFRTFDEALEPELNKRSRLIAATLGDEFEKALQVGVPAESIAGADRFLAEVLADFQEVDHVSVLGADGRVVVVAEREAPPQTLPDRPAEGPGGGEIAPFVVPLLQGNAVYGELRVEISPTYVQTRLEDVLLDVLVVGLIVILLAYELVVWVVAGAVGKPYDLILAQLRQQAAGRFGQVVPANAAGELRRIARRLSDRAIDMAQRTGQAASLARASLPSSVDLRLPLFAFATGAEISGAFLPLHARDLSRPDWLSGEMAAIAPLMAYLAAMACVAPISGTLTRLAGPRRLFLTSIPLAAAALAVAGLSGSVLALALSIGAMALAYALAMAACHEYALRTAPKGEDAQALGAFLFVVIGGAFAGSALGGVLADRLGEGPTFIAGALLALTAGALAAAMMVEPRSERRVSGTAEEGRPAGRATDVLLDARFLALVLGVAVPLNLGMSVFIWYLAPVMLEAEGASTADIGRVVMLYYLGLLLFGPLAARLADGRLGCVPLLVGGMALSGLALASIGVWPGFWPTVFGVSAFGLASAFCEVSQHAQAIRIAEASPHPASVEAGVGAFRLIERLAAMAGLLASAFFVDRMGYPATVLLIGATMLAGSLVVALAEVAARLPHGLRSPAARSLPVPATLDNPAE